MYLDTMQQVLSNSSKVVVDQKGGGNLLYLPLDKLMQLGGSAPVADAAGRGAAAEPPAATPPAAVPAPAETLPRSRDAFRSREREAR
jgi:membrane protease subunit HflK